VASARHDRYRLGPGCPDGAMPYVRSLDGLRAVAILLVMRPSTTRSSAALPWLEAPSVLVSHLLAVLGYHAFELRFLLLERYFPVPLR
jgi:hypothetical protein